ncbi:unnamed protein product [Ectocarpus sp. 4 AP-2014]
MADEGGVGGPKGDGRGKEWTVDLCCKRLSLLHRKLRQVKSLQAQQARDPDSLDDSQRIKLGRKQTLLTEISELEALRRDLRQKEWESDGASAGPKEKKKSRLPPGPFAAANAAGGGHDTRQHQPEEDDGAEYTRDGLRLASPKRRLQQPPPPPPPKPAPPASSRPSAGTPGAAAAATVPPPSLGDTDLFSDGDGGGVSAMEALIKSSMDGQDWEKEEDDGGFDWKEGFEDAGGSSEGREEARPMVEAPAGGYPKRLAGLMSFCRVSDKATCEILVEMGRVTVNGVVARDPGIKVDLLTDIVVANGVAVTFPGKIDNSDETRRPREDAGKRTGPIPKAEKNTWKQKTKYRWGMDDGLLAKRTRRAANAKAFDKKRQTGGGGFDNW